MEVSKWMDEAGGALRLIGRSEGVGSPHVGPTSARSYMEWHGMERS